MPVAVAEGLAATGVQVAGLGTSFCRTRHVQHGVSVSIARDAQRACMTAGWVVAAPNEATRTRQFQAQSPAACRACPRVWPTLLNAQRNSISRCRLSCVDVERQQILPDDQSSQCDDYDLAFHRIGHLWQCSWAALILTQLRA